MMREMVIVVGEEDRDFTLKFPNGKEICIQYRPSNACVGYKGPIDVILPEDVPVTVWSGDDMTPSKSVGNRQEIRIGKQIVFAIPSDPGEAAAVEAEISRRINECLVDDELAGGG